MKRSLILFIFSIAVFVAVVFAGAYGVFRCEKGVYVANISTMGDALWWSLNVCSVGDAGFSPVTASGRIIGAVLIVIGYACFTVNVGIISAVISHRIRCGLENHNENLK